MELQPHSFYYPTSCPIPQAFPKPTGSIYLHCDPTASHYLKLLMDGVFGQKQFRNEIVWSYTGRLMTSKKAFNSKHDIVLFYSKSSVHKLNPVTEPINKSDFIRMKKQKVHVDEDGREWIWGHAGKLCQRVS